MIAFDFIYELIDVLEFVAARPVRHTTETSHIAAPGEQVPSRSCAGTSASTWQAPR